MRVALLFDFGSTYTKVAAVELGEGMLIGRAQAPSTVETDVNLGLEAALRELKGQTGIGIRDRRVALRLACSSARGGLRLVAIGLVPQLTTEAARRAALGAGAKVIRVFSHELSPQEVAEIEALSPDIVLLAGGTDGGNKGVVVHNARCLARSRLQAPVVMAGNKAAQGEVERIFSRAGKPLVVTENVMPELNELRVEPARAAIREVFMARIVQAKGLDRAMGLVDDIIMPTPMAVLEACLLLAEGTPLEPGLGELVVVEVGGATTNVHSIARERAAPGALPKGLPEPYAKRTVEGDLGIRVNAPSVLEAAQANRVSPDLAAFLSTERAREHASHLSRHTSTLPRDDYERRLDVSLASVAAQVAMGRHAGTIQPAYTLEGVVHIQYGKDLREIRTLIGTGGVFAFGADPWAVLRATLYSEADPFSLKPRDPELYIDRDYILYAAGLLARSHPEKAIRLVKRSLLREPSPTP
jgi:uncharacterized protein (TIGR01319 family)